MSAPSWTPFVPRYGSLYNVGDTGSAWDFEDKRWRTFKRRGNEDWHIWEVVEDGANQTCEQPPKDAPT